MKPFNKRASGRADEECRVVLVHNCIENKSSAWIILPVDEFTITLSWCSYSFMVCEQNLFDHWLSDRFESAEKY
jgi:hypothetical protein